MVCHIVQWASCCRSVLLGVSHSHDELGCTIFSLESNEFNPTSIALLIDASSAVLQGRLVLLKPLYQERLLQVDTPIVHYQREIILTMCVTQAPHVVQRRIDKSRFKQGTQAV